jgi:hypothetical protein
VLTAWSHGYEAMHLNDILADRYLLEFENGFDGPFSTGRLGSHITSPSGARRRRPLPSPSSLTDVCIS